MLLSKTEGQTGKASDRITKTLYYRIL